MKHIHQEHEQFPQTLTTSLWLIVNVQMAQYCEMSIGQPMVLLEYPLK